MAESRLPVIYAGPGNDRIAGGRGDDLIDGGEGAFDYCNGQGQTNHERRHGRAVRVDREYSVNEYKSSDAGRHTSV